MLKWFDDSLQLWRREKTLVNVSLNWYASVSFLTVYMGHSIDCSKHLYMRLRNAMLICIENWKYHSKWKNWKVGKTQLSWRVSKRTTHSNININRSRFVFDSVFYQTHSVTTTTTVKNTVNVTRYIAHLRVSRKYDFLRDLNEKTEMWAKPNWANMFLSAPHTLT